MNTEQEFPLQWPSRHNLGYKEPIKDHSSGNEADFNVQQMNVKLY